MATYKIELTDDQYHDLEFLLKQNMDYYEILEQLHNSELVQDD